MAEFEVQGEFWLPGHDDRRVAGVLTFGSRVGGKLALIGSLETKSELLRNASRDHRRILGDDGKDLYTLDDCFRTNSAMIGTELARRETYYVGRIIKGAYGFEKDEPVNVDGVVVRMANLLDWVRIDGVEETDYFDDAQPSTKEWEVVGQRRPSIVGIIDCGKLTLGQQLWREDHGLHGLTVHQDNYARFDFNSALPLDDAIDYASDLQDLISIATNRISAYESFHFYHPAFAHERQDGTKVPRPAELIMDWIAQAQPAAGTLTKHGMVFTFDQFGGMAGVERWMAVAKKYRSMLGHVMNTIYAPFMFVQDKVLHRVAALEAFHKLWSGQEDCHLINRLKELARYAGDPFNTLVGKAAENDNDIAWCKRAKDERNDIAHHLGRQPHQDGATLFYLGQGAYWLLVLCLLREAQAPQAVFDHMVNCGSFRFEARGVQDIL